MAVTMIPEGGTLPGAAQLGLSDTISRNVDAYPPYAHTQVRLLLFALEHYPLLSGYTRRFTGLDAGSRAAYLDRMAHHRRSALRRLVISYIKQLVFGMYVSERAVEGAIGYRYECARPLGPHREPEEQSHH